MLLGLGAVVVAPAAASLAGPVAPALAAGSAAEVEIECLADLIETGAVTRGDLVAR